MYIICSGGVNIYKERRGGQKVLLASLKVGDFFGEMALVDQSPRSAMAIANADTQLAVLDELKFIYLIRNQPHFVLTVMQRQSERLRDANVVLSRLRRKTAKKRRNG